MQLISGQPVDYFQLAVYESSSECETNRKRAEIMVTHNGIAVACLDIALSFHYFVNPFVFSYERSPPIPKSPPRTVRSVDISNTGKSGKSTPEAVRIKTKRG